MICYRLSKYNPHKRNEKGILLEDEWTSVSDIGLTFNGLELTVEDYINVENAYIDFIEYILNKINESYIIVEFEDRRSHDEQKIDAGVDLLLLPINIDINNNEKLDKDTLLNVCRLALREEIWCKVESENNYFIHFGYDYYVYISVPDNFVIDIKNHEKEGLFLEEYTSPYNL